MGSLLSTLGYFASVPSAPWYKYDVFLSFHGPEVRKGFLFNLHEELQNTGHIKPFKDDEELQIGMLISPNLVKAIEESRFAIVVLSPNYATSRWCLDELITIFRCMEGKDRILPVFYNVEPSDVRNQRKSFEESLSKHRENSTQDPEKVEQWSKALKKVGNLTGWELRKFKSERELIENIVECVWRKLRQAQRKRELIKYFYECACSTRVPKVLPQPIAVESTAPIAVESTAPISVESTEPIAVESTAPIAVEPTVQESNMNESLGDYLRKHFSVGPYGSSGGKSFDDGINLTVKQLILCYDKQWIDSIWIEYDVGGSSLWGKHGDQSVDKDKTISTVTLEYPDEFLTSIFGYHEKILFQTQITSLTFKSNKRTFGPFGDGDSLAQTNFSIAVPKSKIVGFHGRSSGITGLRAIGAHLMLLDH